MKLKYFPCRGFQLSYVTDPIDVLRYGVYAGNDSGRYRIYGYGEVTQRLLISVRARGSSSWWWLDRGFCFAFRILMFFLAKGTCSPSGRTVGCMTKVEGGDHRFCFTRLGGSGTSRPLRLSIGMGCSTCVVVCCCFCC